MLRIEDRPAPQPGNGEILVKVFASALNRADLHQRRGSYPAPPGAPPDIPGLEYSGEVSALGPRATLWNVGARVMGIAGGGAHAEYLIVHEREAIAVPAALTWEEAGAVPEAFITAYDAMFRQLQLKVGERLLIHAVGSGVGTSAAQLTVNEAGDSVITGFSLSITVMVKEQVSSVDGDLTRMLCIPTVKKESEATVSWPSRKTRSPQLPVVLASNFTIAPHLPGSLFTVIFCGQIIAHTP